MSYHEKFFQKVRQEHYSLEPGLVTRPEAHGVSRFHFLKPHTEAMAVALLVHSTGNDALYPNGDLILDLLKANIAVFAFDLDGHGKDSSTTLNKAGIFSCVPAAITACRRVVEALGSSGALPVHLIGQSLGGALALAHLAAAGKDITSCVGIAIPRRLNPKDPALLREIAGPFTLDFCRLVNHWGFADSLPALGNFKRKLYPIRFQLFPEGPKSVAAPDKPFFYVTLVDNILREAAAQFDRRKVTVPTLLLSGSRDPIAPQVHAAEWLLELVNGQNILVPSQSHFHLLLSRTVRQHVVAWIVANS